MRDPAADPVRDADEVLAVPLGEVLRAERVRDGEVDRLATRDGEPGELGLGEVDKALGAVAMRKAEQHRPGAETAALAAGALNEPLALERSHEPRGRALRQA